MRKQSDVALFMKKSLFFVSSIAFFFFFPVMEGVAALKSPLKPAALPETGRTKNLFTGAVYDTNLPAAPSIIGFHPGQRAATTVEIERCLKSWSQSSRVKLVEYARSYENRPLYYMVISSPKNISHVEKIKSSMAQLGDPRKTSDQDSDKLISQLPAVAWLGCAIHGDETESSDAALMLLYHLIAAQDDKIEQMLEELVIIVDPLMNPDGRERFIKMIAEHRGTLPNVDDQSLLHKGYWPRGRGNHYFFDLNRDSLFALHPETRGRLKAIAEWNPVLCIDAHGMGPQETHLFSPPREPINLHIPREFLRWGMVFAREQARAFDEQGWLYYNGEWNDSWYPGYVDSWVSFRGAVGILYEQARVAEDGIRRPEGRTLTYLESVQHHLTGFLANLNTLQTNSKALLRDFYISRKKANSDTGPFSQRTFAILPSENQSRFDRFFQLMNLQGFELYQNAAELTVPKAMDVLGRESTNRCLPPGTLLIPNRQPLGYLVAAMLEFDPMIPVPSLEEERKELLLKGTTKIYDITAWNLPMLFGLDALTLTAELPAEAKRVKSLTRTTLNLTDKKPVVAWAFDGSDDRSVTAAARLMERGAQMRVALKPFQLGQQKLSRGSVVITPLDNRAFKGDWQALVQQTAKELSFPAMALSTGLGEEDMPDLGGERFRLLTRPQIALCGRGSVSPYDYGAIWHLLDHQLVVRHSHLDVESLPGLELDRYNVIIVPESGGVGASKLRELIPWIKGGGTLILIGSAARGAMEEKSELSRVREMSDVLEKLSDYEFPLLCEWQARYGKMHASAQIWTHKLDSFISYPWQGSDQPLPELKELKRRDAWQKLFSPVGAIVASRVDQEHWLTFGCPPMLPTMVVDDRMLMIPMGVEAPIRYGYITPSITNASSAAPASTNLSASANKDASVISAKSKDKDSKSIARSGWVNLPEGYDLYLRMSGLIWPEAAQRLVHGAVVTREGLGNGQVILFANSPAFRGATLGQMRILLNSMIYGPGCGARHPLNL